MKRSLDGKTEEDISPNNITNIRKDLVTTSPLTTPSPVSKRLSQLFTLPPSNLKNGKRISQSSQRSHVTLRKEVVFQDIVVDVFPSSPLASEDVSEYVEQLKPPAPTKTSSEPVILQDVVLDDEDFDFSVEKWQRGEHCTFPNARVETEFQRAFHKAAEDKRIAFFLLVIGFFHYRFFI